MVESELRRMDRRGLVGVVAAMLMSPALAAATQYTGWSPPENLGPLVNSPLVDSCVAISKNGLSLIFSSNRHTNNPLSMDRDLYVAKRANIDAPWGMPVRLSAINSDVWDSCPALSLDEHRLYFTSARPGGCGAEDIWVSRRQDRDDDFGWEPALHLACESQGGINSPDRDLTPALFEEEDGRVLMYLTRNRPGSLVFYDILQSVMKGDGSFGPATPVIELNGPAFVTGYAVVRRDGLEVIFGSARGGASGFWTAVRESTALPWSPPAFIPELGNPAQMKGRIDLSFDGLELYFTSTRPGGYGMADLWVARRDRMRGPIR